MLNSLFVKKSGNIFMLGRKEKYVQQVFFQKHRSIFFDANESSVLTTTPTAAAQTSPYVSEVLRDVNASVCTWMRVKSSIKLEVKRFKC